ncbi:MAG: efflux RND transporter permease subunit [Chitinophagaceae bacterium]
MTFTELIIKRPTLVVAVFAVLMGGGIFAYTKLGYELLPDFSSPTLVITIPYPGASPTAVEKNVTEKVEDAISGMDELKRVSSQSNEGAAVIIAEFVPSADIMNKQQDAQQKITNIMSDLPDDIKTPAIKRITPSDMPVMQIITNSNLPNRVFYDLVDKEIVPLLQRVEGMGDITLVGGEQREIQVNANMNKLRYYGISLTDLLNAITSQNMDFPTGNIYNRMTTNSVRLSGMFTTFSEISNTKVQLPSGEYIQVSDVADVADATEKRTTIARLNGQEGIGLVLKKQTGANSVSISNQIKKIIQTLEQEYHQHHLKFKIVDDQATFTLSAAHAVMEDLLIAVILVSLIMLLFLHSIRDSLIVLVAIPASLISTFIALYLFGYTLNLMTLLAMSLVIGILVDDSIVILENIHRHLSMGKDKIRATIDGRQEIAFSAIAITMVDVVVFTPIMFIDNVIGQLLKQYAATIVVSTLMSLVVCFTITPLLASRFSKVTVLNYTNPIHRILIVFEQNLARFTLYYQKLLGWVLRHKIITGSIVLALFGSMFLIFKLGIIGTEMVATGDEGKILVNLEYDKNTPLDLNSQRSLKVEKYLIDLPGVQYIYTMIGSSGTSGVSAFSGISPENKTQILVVLNDEKKDRPIQTNDMIRKLLKELPEKFSLTRFRVSIGGGMNSDAPVQRVFYSNNIQDLMIAGKKLKSALDTMNGVINPIVSVEDGAPEVDIELDRKKMGLLGLDINNIGSVLRTAYTGDDNSKYRTIENDYTLRVQLDQFDRRNPIDINSITFKNNKNQIIQLDQFGTITFGTSPSMIERTNRRFSQTVKADVLGITAGEVTENIAKLVNTAGFLPKSVESATIGSSEQMQESLTAMVQALGASFLLVYFIMVALYNSFIYPFVVLFSLPVALIGAIIALALGMGSISIFTMLGIIMLMGLVAKNGILIVDFTNHLKEKGYTTYSALLVAGKERLRPILMTTIAMVVGMIPIAISKGSGSEWKNGLALVMIGGLLSSLLLTIFVVPMVYYIIDRIQHFGLKKRRKL